MYICSTFPYKVNIKVCKIERKKIVYVRKLRYLAIPGISPISVYAQNKWDVKFYKAQVDVSQTSTYILLSISV